MLPATPPESPEKLDDDATWALKEGHLWRDLESWEASTGGAPSSAASGGTDPLGVGGGAPLGNGGNPPALGVGTCTATVIGQDSCDYSSNSHGQLVREATNVFTDGGFEDFRKGEYAGTHADSATGTVALTRIEGTRCPAEGTYTSMIFDAGRTTTFGTATWTADVPAGTSLRFQVAVSSTAGGPWVFEGPDGTAGSDFTSSGMAFTTPPAGRYVCYRATLASDVGRLASPTLSGFNQSLGGATSRVVSYTYGPHGNVVSRTTVDSATGTTTDVRDSVIWPTSDRINTQDQLLRRDVTSPDGTTVTWRYTYDSAGNMTSKTDGTQTTAYAWDSHNRLVQGTQPDGTPEACNYDANGLMLPSRKSTDTAATTYVWRGNDLVQETAPDVAVTRYNVVNGVLVSFGRGGETYTVQSDATLGHVRSVTGSNGTVLYTARYDAWGSMLAVTDNVPGGMLYRCVGALGVRWDGDLWLYCMRHRWYDPGLQQFMGVDPLKSNADLYEHANEGPDAFIDPSGTKINVRVTMRGTSSARSARIVEYWDLLAGVVLHYNRVTCDARWVARPSSPPLSDAAHKILVMIRRDEKCSADGMTSIQPGDHYIGPHAPYGGEVGINPGDEGPLNRAGGIGNRIRCSWLVHAILEAYPCAKVQAEVDSPDWWSIHKTVIDVADNAVLDDLGRGSLNLVFETVRMGVPGHNVPWYRIANIQGVVENWFLDPVAMIWRCKWTT